MGVLAALGGRRFFELVLVVSELALVLESKFTKACRGKLYFVEVTQAVLDSGHLASGKPLAR